MALTIGMDLIFADLFHDIIIRIDGINFIELDNFNGSRS
jgi:hypothetical protein